MSSRTVFLRTSTHDYERKIHNGRYTVSLDTWPVELNAGVRGVSLISATFPQNLSNINVHNNVLRWEPITGATATTITFTGSEYISWRWYNRDGQVSDWLSSFIPVGGSPYDQGPTLFADVTTQFGTDYATATGGDSSDVVFDRYRESKTSPLSNVPRFTNTGPYRVEFRLTTDPSLDALQIMGYTTAPDSGKNYVGNYSPWSYVTTVAPGSYTLTELTDYLVADIDAQHPDMAVSTLTEISTTDQRLEYKSTGPGANLTIYGSEFGSSLGPLLGLHAFLMSTALQAFPYVPNLHGPSKLFIHSSLLAGRTTIDGDGGIISIARAIPITVGYRDLQTYEHEDGGVPDIAFPRRKHFTEVNITLRDGRGNDVDIGSGELEVLWKLYY